MSSASANAVSVSACPFNVKASVPTRRMRRGLPVEVDISMTSSPRASRNAAGTRYCSSMG